MRRVRITFHWQPAYWATVIGVGMVVAGFLLLLLGWRGAAALLAVPLQLPYAVSGGIAGLALVGFGAALLNLQASRHLAGRERARSAAVLRDAAALMAVAQPDRGPQGDAASRTAS